METRGVGFDLFQPRLWCEALLKIVHTIERVVSECIGFKADTWGVGVGPAETAPVTGQLPSRCQIRNRNGVCSLKDFVEWIAI